MGQVAFISGGVRSGKSDFALRWALPRASSAQRRLFVATAQAFDDEMRERASQHQAERAETFRTLECPFELESQLALVADVDVVVIDCLTLWLSNLLLSELPAKVIEARVGALSEALRSARFDTIVVSNEVGMGIVPDNALARAFRDLTGRAHQRLARASDELYLATMGTILRLKPAPLALVSP